MQFKAEEYNRELHDRWYALSVRQPYAEYIASGVKSIEVRSRYTNYRGELMICASSQPKMKGLESGVALCLVELYDVRPVSSFTEQDWAATMIPKNERPTEGFGWLLRKPRRVVEHPVKGQLGIWRLVYSKDLIIEHPKRLRYDKKSKTWVADIFTKK